ncbi:hypothetical protein BDA96_09G218500 [Sorghum bicolor]|uniref:Uncharacterized protein n=2 Tax=Sorghum bicolor TaxID=4558 RepID=A0A921QDS5_SORBI|nr:hypothetical protein SORBI_3009G206900 [Sorghum bicolor]KAG0518917.1 hypothetical protein BDA96_09G218500 [Sorghum bicolor]
MGGDISEWSARQTDASYDERDLDTIFTVLNQIYALKSPVKKKATQIATQKIKNPLKRNQKPFKSSEKQNANANSNPRSGMKGRGRE